MSDDDLLRLALQNGGILIDGSGAAGHDPVKAAARRRLADAGLFERVAEPGQVPFFRLTAAGEAAARAVA